jgi:uncharacterized protein (DUF697 family)
VGTSATSVYNPTTAGIQATAVGMTLANTTTSSVTASVTLTSGATTVYIIKNTTIPAGNSLSILGDGKFIVEQNDDVKVISSASSSVDVLLSVVEVV